MVTWLYLDIKIELLADLRLDSSFEFLLDAGFLALNFKAHAGFGVWGLQMKV